MTRRVCLGAVVEAGIDGIP